MKPLHLIQRLTEFLTSNLQGEAKSREHELTRNQAVLLALETYHRADLQPSDQAIDAHSEALDALTGARAGLEAQLFALLDPPSSSSSEESEPAIVVETEPKADGAARPRTKGTKKSVEAAPPAAEVPHVPGTSANGAAYMEAALSKVKPQSDAPNG